MPSSWSRAKSSIAVALLGVKLRALARGHGIAGAPGACLRSPTGKFSSLYSSTRAHFCSYITVAPEAIRHKVKHIRNEPTSPLLLYGSKTLSRAKRLNGTLRHRSHRSSLEFMRGVCIAYSCDPEHNKSGEMASVSDAGARVKHDHCGMYL